MPDYAIANERVWPSANDIHDSSGFGKKLLELQMTPWQSGLNRSYVVSGFEAPLSSANLDISIPSGEAFISGYRVVIPGSTTVTCAASSTNYIFLKLTRDGLGKVNGVAFERNAGTDPADSVLIRKCVTSGSAITDTIDARPQLPHTMGGWFGLYNTGSGSSLAMQGYEIISSNTSMGGLNLYGSVRIKAGVTVTANQRALIIYAERTIEIAGTIDASGAGGAGGPGSQTSAAGNQGTDQTGGGGGGDGTNGGWSGGPVGLNDMVLELGGVGGAAGGSGAGGSAAQITGSRLGKALPLLTALAGGAGGGGGRTSNSGTGGNGGGTIVLIAPTIILRATAELNSRGIGGAGSGGANGGGGGGGGAGNIWMLARSGRYIDEGATFTMTGGTGGSGIGAGHAGGAGAAGQKQIMLFF